MADTTTLPFVQESLQANTKTLNFIHSAASAVSGSAAGILGLTSLNGFYFYIITILFTNLVIILINANGKPTNYYKKGSFEAWTEGIASGLFGYVLFWTLAYGLIHIYD